MAKIEIPQTINSKHLSAIKIIDYKNCINYWNIYEENKLILVYFNADDIRVEKDMPDDEHMAEYKYIDELCEIIMTLNNY